MDWEEDMGLWAEGEFGLLHWELNWQLGNGEMFVCENSSTLHERF